MPDLRIYPGGFKLPKGRLTDRFMDFDSPLRLAYERAITYEKDDHTHDEPHLTFPRGSSRLSFELLKEKRTLAVDQSSFLWMPAGALHRQAAKTLIWDNFALYLSQSLIQARRSQMKRTPFPKTSEVFRRSLLLGELVERLFYERVLRRSPHDADLTGQVLDEVCRIMSGVDGSPSKPGEKRQPGETPNSVDTPAVELAVRFLELNLFAEISAPDLARATRTPIPTLYRLFKKEFGMSPVAYQRTRRMDESFRLLQSGDYLVQDVAQLVGYGDLPSFSKAFKRHFGKSPASAISCFERRY